MKKENKLMKFTYYILLLTVIAMILVAGTYARYTSTASGTDSVVVAKWSFEVNGEDITMLEDDETITFDLFKTINDTKDGQKETDVQEGLLAPGTQGSFEFTVNNTSEVTAQYAINFDVTNEKNIPIEYSFDGTNWSKELANIVASDETTLAMGSGPKAITIQWRWAFGENEVTDVSLGGATLTVTASITATQVDNEDNLSVLNGKSAIFFGDSVAYGHQTNGNGFGYYIDTIANLSNYRNAAVNSATLNTETQGENNVIEQIKKNANVSYDYVILQGGFGDLRDEPPIGTLTDGYAISELDTTTFAGAVEYTLYLATTTWENSKIGFIISYDAPNSNAGVRPDHDASKEYWDIVKAACDKWNVAYLDFFEGSTTYNGEIKTYSELFDVTGNTYIADGVHPSATGYEFIVPFIVDWMETLSVYERNFEIITDNVNVNGNKIVTSFDQLVYTADYGISNATGEYGGDSIGRAASVGYYIKVNGGETIGLTDTATGVSYALYEFNDSISSSGGETHSRWLNADVTLNDNTRYVAVSFKNGDGTTSFTDEQLALLPTYLEFKTDNTSSDDPEGYIVVSNFTDLLFTKDSAPSRLGNGYSEIPTWGEGTSIGRATAINYLVKVNGGETIGLSDSATGVAYAVGEVDSNATAINLEMVAGSGQYHGEWLSNDVTLTDNTRYIMVSFKNGDGTTSFTDEQIALLPTYIEFK